jgi:hypothetical protein
MFHRIWLGKEPIPREFEGFAQSWLHHHPGWSMRTWTDVALGSITNKAAVSHSSSVSGIANILRYEILFHFGGIYIDTDFECLHNLEGLLDEVDCFVALQAPDLANNAIMGAVPHHPFIRKLIEGLSSSARNLAGLPSIKQSGPYYLSEQLRGRSDVTVFAPALFYPYQWHERWRRHENFPEAYAVHHWSLSWRRRREKPKPPSIRPQLSIILINLARDVQRLEWAIEGLCDLSISDLFNVVIYDFSCTRSIRSLTKRFSERLHIEYVTAYPESKLRLAYVLERCSAPRVLLLDSHCVVDRSVIDAHLHWASFTHVLLSSHWIYPPEKMYKFVPPVDRDALKLHSYPDPRSNVVRGGSLRTTEHREFLCCCLSLPRHLLNGIAWNFDRVLWQHTQSTLVELARLGYQTVPLSQEAGVIWMAS